VRVTMVLPDLLFDCARHARELDTRHAG
jgi:hypothetical protein